MIAARVIMSYARVKKGLEVGVSPVLDTFNGELHFKPHVHSLVTGGGLNPGAMGWEDRLFFKKEELVRSWQRLVIALLRMGLKLGLISSSASLNEI